MFNLTYIFLISNNYQNMYTDDKQIYSTYIQVIRKIRKIHLYF